MVVTLIRKQLLQSGVTEIFIVGEVCLLEVNLKGADGANQSVLFLYLYVYLYVCPHQDGIKSPQIILKSTGLTTDESQ